MVNRLLTFKVCSSHYIHVCFLCYVARTQHRKGSYILVINMLYYMCSSTAKFQKRYVQPSVLNLEVLLILNNNTNMVIYYKQHNIV